MVSTKFSSMYDTVMKAAQKNQPAIFVGASTINYDGQRTDSGAIEISESR